MEHSELVKLTSTEYTTLTELIGKMHGEKSPMTLLTSEYQREQTLGRILPIAVASDRTEDKSIYKEPWEYNKRTKTSNLDEGAIFSKMGTYATKEILGMREGAIAISEKNYKMQGNLGNWWRAQEAFDLMHSLGLDEEHDMIYADPRKDPNTFLGLHPRYSMVTDQNGIIQAGAHKGEMSPYVTLDAGGTKDGALSSVYLIYPSQSNGVCWLVPGGGANVNAGVEYIQGNFDTVTYIDPKDGYTKAIRQATDLFQKFGGLGIKNRQACIRIANVDLSTDAGFKQFKHCMRLAKASVAPSISAGFYGFVSPETEVAILDRLDDKIVPNSYANTQMPAPKGLNIDFVLDTQRFSTLTHLTNGEERVV